MALITTRQAGSEDLEFAFQTKKAALGPYVAQVWGWNEAEQRELHARRFSSQDVEIIQSDGQDVGLMTTVRKHDALVLNQLFLLPAHQRRAIGTICMTRLIDEARHADLPIRLQVLKVNTRACAFYERLGFVRTGESESHLLLEKQP